MLEKMPFMCGMCRFSTRGTHPVCIATDREHFVDISKGGRPSWCPLKEMPERKRLPHETDEDDILFGKACGWNECIEEMLK